MTYKTKRKRIKRIETDILLSLTGIAVLVVIGSYSVKRNEDIVLSPIKTTYASHEMDKETVFGRLVQRDPIEQEIVDAFSDTPHSEVMVAIAKAENIGGVINPKAYGKNTNGSLDVGALQINEDTYYDFMRRHETKVREIGVNNYLDLVDLDKNAKFARLVYDEQGLNAWTTYRTGKYKQYLDLVAYKE